MKSVTGRAGKTGSTKPRRKRKAKPTPRDGLRAAAVAALFVAVAGASAFVVALSRSAASVPPPLEAPPSAQAVPETAPAVEVPVPVGVVEPKPAAALPSPPASVKSPPKTNPSPIRETPKPVPVAVRSAPPPERDPRPAPRKKGTVVFVIDDVGNNLHELDPFLKYPGPLTVAVLPGLPHSAAAARRARAAGKEVLLHQPMEAIGGQNPGPGAIYTGMNEAEIRAILARNVAEVGPVVGINNHQGSKITADERTMKIVLAFCRERGLFFLDSRTTAETVAPAVAAGLGMSVRERDVFLDNIPERAAMIRYLQEGLQKAEKKGSAVMIGHAWSSELASTLQELYPELIEQGFSLSSIARIMMGTYDDEGLGD